MLDCSHKVCFKHSNFFKVIFASQQRKAKKRNYEHFNHNKFNIRYWNWYYRGCWHQDLPSNCSSFIRFNFFSFYFCRINSTKQYVLSLYPSMKNIQFARLLLPLEIKAISQASSPDSNPHSPSPVNVMVIQYITIKLIGMFLVCYGPSYFRMASSSGFDSSQIIDL